MDPLPIRVLLASTDRLSCDVLAAALDKQSDMTVSKTLAGVEKLRLYLGTFDVAVLHARLAPDDIVRAIRAIRKSPDDSCAIVIGAPHIAALALPYIEAGARGFVSTEDPVEVLQSAVRRAFAGAAVVTPALARAMLLRLVELSRAVERHAYGLDKGDLLSRRELEVLEHIERGMSNLQIATELSIQEGTVKNHVHSILSKLQVEDRKQAAAWLRRQQSRSSDGRWQPPHRRASWRRARIARRAVPTSDRTERRGDLS